MLECSFGVNGYYMPLISDNLGVHETWNAVSSLLCGVESCFNNVLMSTKQVNPGWWSLFPDSFSETLPFPGSDHLRLHRPWVLLARRQHRLFRFDAHWMRHKECEDLICQSWEINGDGNHFDQLFKGIQS